MVQDPSLVLHQMHPGTTTPAIWWQMYGQTANLRGGIELLSFTEYKAGTRMEPKVLEPDDLAQNMDVMYSGLWRV